MGRGEYKQNSLSTPVKALRLFGDECSDLVKPSPASGYYATIIDGLVGGEGVSPVT
jgi:hypothetical protein